MSAPSRAVLKKVREWIKYADDDLLFARHGLTIKSGSPYRLVAFHAQQSAEKFIKSYLVYHSIDFPYTHDIRILLKLCMRKASWPEELKDAEELTPFAFTL